MIEKTEIILKNENDEELVATVDNTLPLKLNDTFYYSVNEFYPRDEKEYKEKSQTPEKITNMYLDSILEKCDKYHIKKFKVVDISKSLTEDYSKGLNERDKLHEFHTSITVIEV